MAAQYGDPELIFRYEWIPSIPGVNVPGDYESEYASNPWQWIMQEWEKIKSETYDFYVEDYSLQGPLMLEDSSVDEPTL